MNAGKIFRMHMLVPGSDVIEAQDFELTPTNAQGEEVCDLFHRFLRDKPAEFRLRLPFLKHDDIEMEWAAAPGGTALCTFYEDDSPLASAVLLSGLDRSSDQQMATLYEAAILEPFYGEEGKKALGFVSFPAVAVALLSAAPERAPALQLFYAALASVFFRQMSKLRGSN
jgi:hypothetical protein